MNVADAVALINGLALPPGWAVEASDHSHRYQDTLTVKITALGGTNSDECEAPDYPTAIAPQGPWASFPIHVGDCDRDEVIGRVIDRLVEAFTHEIREFVRCQDSDGRWIAPFHPHRHQGILAWSARTGADPARDYSYGLS